MIAWLIVLGLVALAAGAGCLYLFMDRGRWRGECDRLRGELEVSEARGESLTAELGNLRHEVVRADEKLKALERAQETALTQFESIAGKALRQSNEHFLQLARKVFEGEQKDAAGQLEQRKQAIAAMVDPIRLSLEKHEKLMQQVETSARVSHGALGEQVRQIIEGHKELRQSTDNLVRALRRPEVRGKWGEIQLKRVAELAGMIEHCDFEEQVSFRTADGLGRPDMMIRLTRERSIVVDAKTPLDAFIEAHEAQDDEVRAACLRRHAGQVKDQVRKLAKTDYPHALRSSADFVVMFIPGESFLYAATQQDPALIEWALEQRVVIAAPTTLITLLRACAMGWREERLAENAARISDLGKELHERLCVAADHIEKLGKAIETSVKHYNSFVGSYEGRVMTSARKFKELGADSAKSLPEEMPRIEATPREVTKDGNGDTV